MMWRLRHWLFGVHFVRDMHGKARRVYHLNGCPVFFVGFLLVDMRHYNTRSIWEPLTFERSDVQKEWCTTGFYFTRATQRA